MKIVKEDKNGSRYLKIVGRIDTSTAPQLEEALDTLDGVKELLLDFEGVEYLSSAGLRVLLTASKKMKEQGTMEVHHVNKTVMEAFEITGFTEILTIRE